MEHVFFHSLVTVFSRVRRERDTHGGGHGGWGGEIEREREMNTRQKLYLFNDLAASKSHGTIFAIFYWLVRVVKIPSPDSRRDRDLISQSET